MGARIASFANLLPNARIVAHQSGWQWSARCEESHPGAVVAVGVDGGHVFHLLEAIHLILWVLQQTQNNNVNWYFFKNGRYRWYENNTVTSSLTTIPLLHFSATVREAFTLLSRYFPARMS